MADPEETRHGHRSVLHFLIELVQSPDAHDPRPNRAGTRTKRDPFRPHQLKKQVAPICPIAHKRPRSHDLKVTREIGPPNHRDVSSQPRFHPPTGRSSKVLELRRQRPRIGRKTQPLECVTRKCHKISFYSVFLPKKIRFLQFLNHHACAL